MFYEAHVFCLFHGIDVSGKAATITSSGHLNQVDRPDDFVAQQDCHDAAREVELRVSSYKHSVFIGTLSTACWSTAKGEDKKAIFKWAIWQRERELCKDQKVVNSGV